MLLLLLFLIFENLACIEYKLKVEDKKWTPTP